MILWGVSPTLNEGQVTDWFFFPVLITPCFYHNTNQLSFFPKYLAPHRLLVSASFTLNVHGGFQIFFLPSHRWNALFGVQNVFPWGVWAEVSSPREKYHIRFFIYKFVVAFVPSFFRTFSLKFFLHVALTEYPGFRFFFWGPSLI